MKQKCLQALSSHRYEISQAGYAVACTSLGLIFSHVHELKGSVEEMVFLYWPLLLTAAMTVYSFATLFAQNVFQGCRNNKYNRLMVVMPAIAGMITLVCLRYDAASGGHQVLFPVSVISYALTFCMANCLLINPSRLYVEGTHAANMRYSLVIPTVLISVLHISLGGSAPLLLEGYTLTVFQPLLFLGYCILWYATRGLKRASFTTWHLGTLLAFCVMGAAFYIAAYLFQWLDDPVVTYPCKVFFLSLFVGLYLSIPEGYALTWDQQKINKQEKSVSDRLRVLGALLTLYDLLVYLTYLGLNFSPVYLVCYSIGSASLSIYVKNRHTTHPRWGQLFICIGSISVLAMEFGHLWPRRLYALPEAKWEYVGIALTVINLLRAGKQILKTEHKALGNKIETVFLSFSENRCGVLIVFQFALLISSGWIDYSPKVQMVLTAALFSCFLEMIYELIVPRVKKFMCSFLDSDSAEVPKGQKEEKSK